MGHRAHGRRRQALWDAAVETLEDRQFFAVPVIQGVGDPVVPLPAVPARKSLIVPVRAADNDGDALAYSVQSSNPNFDVVLSSASNPYLELSVPGYGVMTFELLRDVAPRTVDAIVGLVNGHFYDGLTFHQVLNGTYIRGGDHTPDDANDLPPFLLDDEYHPDAIFTGSGQLAMANKVQQSGQTLYVPHDNNGTQFFVTKGARRDFDFKHVIFGQLVRGHAVLNEILAAPVDGNLKPTTDVVIERARIVQNDQDRVLTVKANAAAAGQSATITVTVDDGHGGTDLRIFNVSSEVDTVNSPPVLGPVLPTTTPASTPVELTLTGFDLDGDPLTFASAVTSGGGVSSTNGNVVTVTPGGNAGPVTVFVQVIRGLATPLDFDKQHVVIGVGDSPVAGTAQQLTGTEGVEAPFAVATFTDDDLAGLAGDFTASINWGDGTSTFEADGDLILNGQITKGQDGTYTITGEHAFRGAGSFPVTVSIIGNKGVRATVYSTATIAAATITPAGVNINGDPFVPLTNVVVGTFTDQNRLSAAGDFAAAINWGDGLPPSIGTVVKLADGTYEVRGTHTYIAPGAFGVTVTVADDVSDDQFEIASTAAIATPPIVITTGAGQTIVEGDTFARAITFADPVGTGWTATVDYGDGAGPQPVAVDQQARSIALAHAYTDNANRQLVIVVTNDQQVSSTATIDVSVQSAAPFAAVAAPATGVRQQARTIQLSATDDSPDDVAAGFTFAIDWGDGRTDNVDSATATHAYAAAGTYTITVTPQDQDGVDGIPVTATIMIRAVDLQPDPANPGKLLLVVGGTAAADTIAIKPGSAKSLRAVINGKLAGAFTGASRVLVLGGAGNDRITLATTLKVGGELRGDAGNDVLTGGGANDVLLGGAGNDKLFGGAGRDVLIGGAHRDSLDGGAGDDILVAGSTTHDGADPALAAIRKEWSRTTVAYKTRVAHLRGTAAGGANGAVRLTKPNLTSDAHADRLLGGDGLDWFLFNTTAGVKDVVGDRLKSEARGDID